MAEPSARFPFPVAGLGPLPLPPEVRFNQVVSAVAGLFETIASIDDRLFHIAHLLDRSQPSAGGKLSVRFRRARSKTADGQVPVFVRWSRPPESRAWHATVLPATGILRKATIDRLFRPTHRYVPPLLREARSLMARRASLLKIVDLAHRTMVLNTGLARKQVARSKDLYATLEPQVEATRAQALADYHAKKAAEASRYAQAKS